MKNLIILIFIFCIKLSFSQHKYFYFPKPNETNIKEIHYRYGEFKIIDKKEKYFYTKGWKLDKIEALTPFHFITNTKKYHYDKNGKISEVFYYKKFNYAYKKDKYTHFPKKYVVTKTRYGQLQSISTYDSLDRKIKDSTFFNNRPSYKYEYIYKGDNKKYSEYFQYNSENKLEEKETFTYNKNNDEIKIIREKPNKLIETEISKYDDKNNYLYNLITDSNGRIIRRITKEYKKDTKTTTTRWEDNVLSSKEVSLYENNLLKSQITLRTGILDTILNVNSKSDYYYDKHKNLLSISSYKKLTGKLFLERESFYNKKKHLIKEKKYYLGKIEGIEIFNKGLKISQQNYTNDKVWRIVKYKYDKKGNLILISERNINTGNIMKTEILYDEFGRKTYKDL